MNKFAVKLLLEQLVGMQDEIRATAEALKATGNDKDWNLHCCLSELHIAISQSWNSFCNQPAPQEAQS